MNDSPFITVIIKTLNEQDGIAKTITSIQESISGFQHKIIVADSLSTDDTQSIALKMGVTVVSLVNPEDRCCGVGHQLGYLHSQGDYLLLLDGDMQLEEGFVDNAVHFLEQNKDYAGVAGRVEMDEAKNYEFQSRKQRLHSIYPIGDVDHLAGGGMYRRSAINDIGYLTNRNLHANEEAELGMRLTRKGYKLHRLDVPYFYHTSYDLSTFQLLKHRWKSKYLWATGEILRGAIGTPYFFKSLNVVKNEVIFAGYLLALLLSLLSLNLTLIGIGVCPLIMFISLKTWRNGSVKTALLSVFNLTLYSVGFLCGLMKSVKDPYQPPEHNIIK
ncbi:MAG: glycosyltransferase [Psychromonas sp.]